VEIKNLFRWSAGVQAVAHFVVLWFLITSLALGTLSGGILILIIIAVFISPILYIISLFRNRKTTNLIGDIALTIGLLSSLILVASWVNPSAGPEVLGMSVLAIFVFGITGLVASITYLIGIIKPQN
jgi:hypothetical protein